MKKLILVTALLPSLVLGSGYQQGYNQGYIQGQKQEQTVNISLDQPADVYNTYETQFSDNRLTGGIAATAAMGMIPTFNHRKNEHGHTGIGIGIANYNGVSSLALGLEHHMGDDVSLKAAIGLADSEQVYGVGGMWGF